MTFLEKLSLAQQKNRSFLCVGQPVANIAADGNFRHFTEALEPGEHAIVIVGQNRRGGTARQERTIVVPK
jgi:hypothetical protein